MHPLHRAHYGSLQTRLQKQRQNRELIAACLTILALALLALAFTA